MKGHSKQILDYILESSKVTPGLKLVVDGHIEMHLSDVSSRLESELAPGSDLRLAKMQLVTNVKLKTVALMFRLGLSPFCLCTKYLNNYFS